MKDILGKINKTIDVITDAMVEQIPSENEVKEYCYSDLNSYAKKMILDDDRIKRFTVAIEKATEFSGKVYANEHFIIRIVMLDEEGRPIYADAKGENYLGTTIIAEAIDAKLKEKMSGQSKKTFAYRGGK